MLPLRSVRPWMPSRACLDAPDCRAYPSPDLHSSVAHHIGHKFGQDTQFDMAGTEREEMACLWLAKMFFALLKLAALGSEFLCNNTASAGIIWPFDYSVKLHF